MIKFISYESNFPLKTKEYMKFLVLLSALVSSLGVQAGCKSYEALIFGEVTHASKSGQTCIIEVSINQIQEHKLCPLASNDIVLSKIEDENCEYILGDSIDGYIIKIPGKNNLLLDK